MASIIQQTEKLITGKEFFLLEEPERCELVQGRVVPMPPPPGFDHGATESGFTIEIGWFVRTHDLGRIAGGEVGLYTGRNPDTVRAADLLFISHERYAKRDRTDPYLDVAPELIVEIRSVSNTKVHIAEKVTEYFAIGVKLVWVADPKTRCVDVYRSPTDIRRLTATDELSGEEILPGFSVPVARFFE
jgi:Uma2 family endonuclease